MTRPSKMRESAFAIEGLVVLHVDVVVSKSDEGSTASAPAASALASAFCRRARLPLLRGVHLQALLFGWGSRAPELSAESL